MALNADYIMVAPLVAIAFSAAVAASLCRLVATCYQRRRASCGSTPEALATAPKVVLLGRRGRGPELAKSAAKLWPQCDGKEDPFRWSFVPSTGIFGSHAVHVQETDLAEAKAYFMHKPTHDPVREAAGEYSSSWHLWGRKRRWEVRIQLRFKQLPEGPLYFGMEYTKYTRMSRWMSQIEGATAGSARMLLGRFYSSRGDDPAERVGKEELEPPTYACPLAAVDQLIVSQAGEEPDIASDLRGKGVLRSEGFGAFQGAVEAAMSTVSTDKVYTLCIWCPSRVIDTLNWQAVTPGGFRVDANRFVGSPPVLMTVYTLRHCGTDPRHLVSRKRYYTRLGFWSARSPPEKHRLHEALQLDDAAERRFPEKKTRDSSIADFAAALCSEPLSCCVGSRWQH